MGAGTWGIGGSGGVNDGDNLEATVGGEGVTDADDVFGSSTIRSGVEDEVLGVVFGWSVIGTVAVGSMGGDGGGAALEDGGGCVGSGGGDGDCIAGGAATGVGGGGGCGDDWRAIGVVASICTSSTGADCSASEADFVSAAD